MGNSFSGADDKWVQNFFNYTKVQPDGTVNTWSHWDEGGRKFGVDRDGHVIGNKEVEANSLEVTDKANRRWKLEVVYTDPKHQEWEFVPKGITCDGKAVTFPELSQPMAIAMANDGSLTIADSGTGLRQQVMAAIRTGRKLNWDPALEQFVDDKEADSLLAREQRKPLTYDRL